ncbi:hypothetical protein DFH11DRAFT_1731425 [Phellopilus nigrolimitatus]|nr:hypothetical protein DFH11DRAFT_1731425 [Phellopilus nigrolimitatus]
MLFSVRPDVQNAYLERHARRALVGLFGEGWCTAEFSTLPQKTKDGFRRGLAKRATWLNVFSLLFTAQAALHRLGALRDLWAQPKCTAEQDWVDIMENGGLGRFEDGERVEWVMDAMRRSVMESNSGLLYQASTLISLILLRTHPTKPNETLLSSTSHIRVQVEQAQMDTIRWLRRRWMDVRQESGFDALKSWAPVEDLLGPASAPTRGPPTCNGLRPTLSRQKNMARGGDRGNPPPFASSDASVRIVTRSIAPLTASRTLSRLTANTTTTECERKQSRPDSKLAPSTARCVSPNVNRASSSSQSAMDVDADANKAGNPSLSLSASLNQSTNRSTTSLAQRAASTASSRRPGVGGTRTLRAPAKDNDSASLRTVYELTVLVVQWPKSVAASVSPVRSHASTICRNASASVAGQSTLHPPLSDVCPTSATSSATMSNKSEVSSVFKSARESPACSRRVSAVSNVSAQSGKSTSRSSHADTRTPGNGPSSMVGHLSHSLKHV